MSDVNIDSTFLDEFFEFVEQGENNTPLKRSREEVIKEAVGYGNDQPLPKKESRGNYIEEMANSMSRYVKESEKNPYLAYNRPLPIVERSDEDRLTQVERQVHDFRRMISEGTMVSGIGHGAMGMAYGSGEVNFMYLDDVYGLNHGNEWPEGSYPMWDGTQFVPSDGAQGGGGASVDVSPTPPPNADDGDLWWNENNGTLYIYYCDVDSCQWVQTVPTGVQGATGSFISQDNKVVTVVNGLITSIV